MAIEKGINLWKWATILFVITTILFAWSGFSQFNTGYNSGVIEGKASVPAPVYDKATCKAFVGTGCPEPIVCEKCPICPVVLDYSQLAHDYCLDEIKDHYDLGYDEEEINWYNIDGSYAVRFDDDGAYDVTFTDRVKYKDDIDKETVTYTCLYEVDEDGDEDATITVV